METLELHPSRPSNQCPLACGAMLALLTLFIYLFLRHINNNLVNRLAKLQAMGVRKLLVHSWIMNNTKTDYYSCYQSGPT